MRLYVNISMGLILQNITALILSVLLVAGSNGLSLYAHFCEAGHDTSVSFNQEDVECAHEKQSCSRCDLSLHAAEHHNDNLMLNNNCCETQQYALQFDQFTDNLNKSKKELKSPVVKVKCNPILNQLLIHHQEATHAQPDDFLTDIAPILPQSRTAQGRHCLKTSPDPDLL